MINLHSINLNNIIQQDGWWFPGSMRARVFHYFPNITIDPEQAANIVNEDGTYRRINTIERPISLCGNMRPWGNLYDRSIYGWLLACTRCQERAHRRGLSPFPER